MYESILSQMNQRYQQLTKVTPSSGTDLGIRFQVVAGELAKLYQQVEQGIDQMFPQTSTGNALQYHGSLKGLTRKSGESATGLLEFSRLTPAQNTITIPEGTVVATNTTPQLYAKTTESAQLAEGSTSVLVAAAAEQPGLEGNFQTGAIAVLVSTPSGISKVTNPQPFVGGIDEESESAFRERVLSAYQVPSNGSNVGYYQQLAASINGVDMVKVLPRSRGRGTVDIAFTTNDPLQEDKVFQELSRHLLKQKEIAVDLKVSPATRRIVNLSLALLPQQEYALAPLKEAVKETIEHFLRTLPIGEPLRLSHLGKMILETPGVEDYSFSTSSKDLYPLPAEKLVLGTLTFTEWGS